MAPRLRLMPGAKNDARRVFLKKGTCSRTFFFLLDREFGRPRENEERASDPLAGGLLNTGHQCGMLWGATLATGAEAFRRHPDREKAMTAAIRAARAGLEREETALPGGVANCASVVAGKMGGSEEEMVTAAGLAGGIGLSGNACGALIDLLAQS